MKLFRPILSIALAMLVLFSSSSFSIGIHLCRGQIKNMALFGKADSCEKEKSLPPCHRHESAPCCQDKTVVHEGQGFKHAVTEINIAMPTAIIIEHPPVLISEIIPSAPLSHIQYSYYDPPLRSYDRTVSLQVFLI